MIKNILALISIFIFSIHLNAQIKMEISDKKIVKSIIVSASKEMLWQKWTTHDGLKTFFGSDNKIELKPGGAFEIYFLMDSPLGLRGSETCKVLSYLPSKYLSFSWNFPPEFPELRNSDYKTWVVVEIEELSAEQCKLTLTHYGWPTEDKWQVAYNYFDKAWDYVFTNLSKVCKTEKPIVAQEKKVTGIGGVFFKCKDPVLLKEWYKKHLGLNTDDYGTNFEWRESADASKKGYTQWSPFKETTKYFEPSTKEFMINYRVQNLEALMLELKKDGVTITDSIQSYDYGKFLHIMDLEGNKVELWEAVDEEYDKILDGVTK